jgi:hypothetical protein
MPSSYVIGEHFESFIKEQIQRGADSGAGIPAKAVFAAARKRIASSGGSAPRRK